ncbi:MAG: hypothetical protein ACO3CD_06485 [Candidatus Nanopelagicaceae bacterium]
MNDDQLLELESIHREDFRKMMTAANAENILYGEYFAAKGDRRIKDKIISEVGKYIQKYNKTTESILSDIDRAILATEYQTDKVLQQMIFEQAVAELKTES